MARRPAVPRPVAHRSPSGLTGPHRRGGFHQAVGFLIDAERSGVGYCTVVGKVEGRHLNINGAVHGGVYATILDTAMGGGVITTLRQGETAATASLYVEFLRAAGKDAVLRARGDVLRRGRHLAFVEGNLYDGEGHRLSQAHGTWYIWSADEPPSARRRGVTRPSDRSGARSSPRS
ncbi:MAG: PaaI family thioesterase [Thermoplasmata archaeon]